MICRSKYLCLNIKVNYNIPDISNCVRLLLYLQYEGGGDSVKSENLFLRTIVVLLFIVLMFYYINKNDLAQKNALGQTHIGVIPNHAKLDMSFFIV